MKRELLSILIAIMCIYSCDKNDKEKIYEGYLYITFINAYDVRSLVADDKLDELKMAVVNFDSTNKSKSEKELNSYYRKLIDYDLFDRYVFQLKLKGDEIINVYANKDEYSKLNEKMDVLDIDKEKIFVKFEGGKISDGVFNRAIYSAKKIIFIEKTKGKTDWHK